MAPVTGSALRIGSRPSALAMLQARLIKDSLERVVKGLAVEIVPIRTSGDKMQSGSLARLGGKGLFVRELEQALTEHRIDLAVHSMKDLPARLASPYRLAAVPARENPHDVLITRARTDWDGLPEGTRLGTSSPRRRFQALRRRPDLDVQPLRGNVDTRLRKLQSGEFDALILALAGLRRLGRVESTTAVELDRGDFVPAGGQGALAVEALSDGPLGGSWHLEQAVRVLNHLPTLAEVTAERAFLATIGASCVSPVGVNGKITGDRMELRTLLFSPDGARHLTGELSQKLDFDHLDQLELSARRLGERLGLKLLENGAAGLIGCD